MGISNTSMVFEYPLLCIWQFECSVHIFRGPWVDLPFWNKIEWDFVSYDDSGIGPTQNPRKSLVPILQWITLYLKSSKLKRVSKFSMQTDIFFCHFFAGKMKKKEDDQKFRFQTILIRTLFWQKVVMKTCQMIHYLSKMKVLIRTKKELKKNK